MKSLTQLSRDFAELCSMFGEFAKDLREVVGDPPVQAKIERMPVVGPDKPEVTKQFSPTPTPDAFTSRKLTKEEKAEIKKDWESLPPELRTKTNRAALARKWEVRPEAIFQINNPNLLKYLHRHRTGK